tara:strand:+ start:483 stop:800 length:318 start_codon:yes stop_codon:yes gene_type:complete
MEPNKKTAIYQLAPGCSFSLRGVEIVNWEDNGTGISQPTEEEINTELARQQAEYDAQDYARKREAAYPLLKDFAEAYTEKEFGGDATKMDAYKIKYEKVRSDNPK